MNRTTLFSKTLQSLILGGMLLLFQSCGPSHIEGVTSQSSLDTDFLYPYSEKPVFLAQFTLLKPATSIENLAQFQFAGSVVHLDTPASAVSYKTTIVDSAGLVLCPTHEGQLLPGQTLISFSCVSKILASSIIVTLEISANGHAQVLRREFK